MRKAFRLSGSSVREPGRENIVFENFQGVDVISDNTALPKKLVPYAKNADFSKRIGSVAKRDGVRKLFDSLGTGGCIGIHTYRSAAGDRVLFGWGNALYKLAGTSNSLTKTTQADWQAGQGYNTDLTGGDIKLAAAPTSSFTRNTAAYRKDGSQAASGSVRYEPGLFGNGIFIERGTTNLLPNPLFTADLSGWSQASQSNWSYGGTAAARQTGGGAVGSAYVKLGDGTNTGKGMATTNNIAVTAGWSYTLSWHMKTANTASQAIALVRMKNGSGTNISATVTPPTGWSYTPTYDALYPSHTTACPEANVWKRFSETLVMPSGVASVQVSIQYYDGGDKYVSVSAPQFENKTCRTSFMDGTRDGENLAYTISALPAEFLAGGVIKPEWDSSAADVEDGYMMFACLWKDSQNNCKVLFVTNSGDARRSKVVVEKTVGGTRTDLIGNALSFSAGDTIRWAAAQLSQAYGDLAAGMHLWVRVNSGGVQHATLSNTATLSNVTTCYIGSNGQGNNYVNGTVDDFFIENIAARNTVGQAVSAASIEDMLESGSAYSVSAATVLYVSGDNAITAPRCPGVWLSPVYDLGSNPEIASISWTATEPANTDCSVKIRSSSDGVSFGVWQSLSSGSSIPLLRYQQVRVDQSTTDNAATPAFSDFTINYESSLNQAVAVKTGLPGTKIRFANYDNKCYWCAGGRLQVFDGSTNRDVGTDPPAAAPTIAAGGGTGLSGVYKACVTFVTSDGHESNPSPVSSPVTLSNQNIQWSSIPVGGARVVKRNLYRTKAGGSDFYFVAALSDNVTATYTDSTADSALVSLMENNNNIPGNAAIVHAHKNYIFYVSADDPKKLFFSKVANPESYPLTYYKLFPGDIVSVKSYFNYLLVSGHNWTKAVEGSIFGGALDDTVIRDVDDIGALSHEGLADCIDPQYGNVLAYPTPNGIGCITPGIQEKSLSRIPLSKDVQPYFDQAVNRQNTAGVFSDNRYLVAINSPQSTHNDLVLCYDFRTKKWNGVWTLKASGFCVANRKVYMASSTEGVICEMFSGTSDAGEKIHFVLDSIYTATKYGANYKKKFLQAWIAVSDDSVTDTMQVKFKVDNQGGTVQPGNKGLWNAGTWSGDIYGKQNAILSPKLKIPAGKGYYYGVRIEDDSANPFTVFAIITEFEPPVLGD
ncbi:MAG: hypothetical protein K6T66_14400 [Peptococcaceae bacterium]|nr:hypothetical protein [Peptococcaceae bacterium]